MKEPSSSCTSRNCILQPDSLRNGHFQKRDLRVWKKGFHCLGCKTFLHTPKSACEKLTSKLSRPGSSRPEAMSLKWALSLCCLVLRGLLSRPMLSSPSSSSCTATAALLAVNMGLNEAPAKTSSTSSSSSSSYRLEGRSRAAGLGLLVSGFAAALFATALAFAATAATADGFGFF